MIQIEPSKVDDLEKQVDALYARLKFEIETTKGCTAGATLGLGYLQQCLWLVEQFKADAQLGSEETEILTTTA